MTEIMTITHLALHDDEGVAEFERLFAECVEIVRHHDQGTLHYEAFVDARRSSVVVVERYEDVAAVSAHVRHVGAELMGKVMATGTVRQEVFGPDDPDLRQLAQQASAELFTPLRPPPSQ